MMPIFIQDAIRTVCPDVSGEEWTECAANLSYEQIKKVCSSLTSEDDIKQSVEGLFKIPADDSYPEHPDLIWNGCLFNSVTGSHAESYKWAWDGEHYIVKDYPRKFCASDVGSSVSAFDTITTEGSECKSSFESSLLAYMLIPLTYSGSWIAKPAVNNQEEINRYLYSIDVRPIWGPGYDTLPTLYIREISPTLMVTKTVLNDDFSVVGIFFRSLTGYDYAIR
jgi:hypothetical protein